MSHLLGRRLSDLARQRRSTVRGGYRLSMIRKARATQVHELDAVIDLIHDCWFDYDEADPEMSGLNLDPERKQLSIAYYWEDWDNIKRDRAGFFLKSKGEIPTYRATLRIEGVEQLEIHDQSAIGGSSFNTLRYDARKGELRILDNYDIHITAKVDHLDVSVIVTDESMGVKRVTEYFGGLIQTG